MITHRGIDYITLEDFTNDIELKNTFIGLIKRDKRFSLDYEDVGNVFYYKLNRLNIRLKSFNKKYHKPGYIRLCEFEEKSSSFTGFIGGSKIDKIVLPLYKTNGKNIKSKSWIIYKEVELKKAFRLWQK